MRERPRRGDGEFPPTRKSLGQHFLTDRRILERIADSLRLAGGETVVEIGPGRGALTDLLADRAGRLVAIEYDRALAERLRERYASRHHVIIAQADVLEVSPGAMAAGPYVLVGNVPYYITTPILFHGLAAPRPERAVYLVQKEVADRLAAAPGSKAYGALTVNVAAFARVESLFRVPPGAFSPPPTVDSAVVRLTPLDVPLVTDHDAAAFRQLVLGAFGMRRKQMRRVLRSLCAFSVEDAEWVLAQCGIDPAARPETLSPVQFVELLRTIERARAGERGDAGAGPSTEPPR